MADSDGSIKDHLSSYYQSNLVFTDNKVTGTLNYVDCEDYSETVSEQSGHYMPIKIDVPGSEIGDYQRTIEFLSNGTAMSPYWTASFSPYKQLVRVPDDATDIRITVTDLNSNPRDSIAKTYSLADLVLEPSA